MSTAGDNVNWIDLWRAHRRAPLFSAFLKGVDVALPTGEMIRLRIESVRPALDTKLFQFFAHAYIAEMRAPGFTEFGYAEATHPLIAIQKSISEAVERCLFRALKGSQYGTTTSNGWAAHVTCEKAEHAALLELLERDAVLIHALREIPFLEIKHDTLPSWLQNFL